MECSVCVCTRMCTHMHARIYTCMICIHFYNSLNTGRCFCQLIILTHHFITATCASNPRVQLTSKHVAVGGLGSDKKPTLMVTLAQLSGTGYTCNDIHFKASDVITHTEK